MATYNSQILIYGGTASGLMAAVRAARRGYTVTLLEWTPFIGGLVTGGLGLPDYVGTVTNNDTMWGLTREFFQGVETAAIAAGAVEDTGLVDVSGVQIGYGRHPNGMIRRYAPSWARSSRDAMLAGVIDNLTVIKDIELGSVEADPLTGLITGVTLTNGDIYTAGQFCDASYEVDLARMAGETVTYGREGVASYGEYNAGYAPQWQGDHTYRVVSLRGDRWKFYTVPPKDVQGTCDYKSQAEDFRMTLSTESDRRGFDVVPYAGFRMEEYADWVDETNVRTLDNIENIASYQSMTTVLHTTNGADWPGKPWGYPRLRTKAQRLKYGMDMYKRHSAQYYVSATNLACPAALRTSVLAHGLPGHENTDEYFGRPGWSSAWYTRAPQRMIGREVLNFNDMTDPRRKTKPDPISMGGYNVDRHPENLHPTISGGNAWEGTIEDDGRGYYQITQKSQQGRRRANLVVTVGNSTSEIFQCSERMEPTWMVCGDAAGFALGAAIEQGVPVGRLPYAKLRPLLDAADAALIPT